MALSSGDTPMSRAWRSEAVAGCSLLTVALLLGWAAGSIYTAMMLALLLYLLRPVSYTHLTLPTIYSV